ALVFLPLHIAPNHGDGIARGSLFRENQRRAHARLNRAARIITAAEPGSAGKMGKALGLFVALFALWLALSGYFKPFLLSLGVLSCLFTVYLARRMKLLDDEAVPLQLSPSLFLYWGWLGREILKSSIAVCKIILSRDMAISQ